MAEQNPGLVGRVREFLRKSEEKNTLKNPIVQLGMGYGTLSFGILFLFSYVFMNGLYLLLVGLGCVVIGYPLARRKTRLLKHLSENRREELGYPDFPRPGNHYSNKWASHAARHITESLDTRPIFTLGFLFLSITVGVLSIIVGLMLLQGLNIEGTFIIVLGYILLKFGYVFTRDSVRTLVHSSTEVSQSEVPLH